MPLWIAVLLGAVQGLTEFLPVSSSGHLALVQSLVDFNQYGAEQVAFTIVVHLGTLAAVCAAFWGDIVKVLKALIAIVLDGFKTKQKPSRRLTVMLIISCLPLVVGALIEGYVEAAFENTLFIGAALIVTAALLYTADRVAEGKKDERDAKYTDALKVGLMQLIAVFPGVSRSGATICGGLFAGFKRDFAVRFAFLMSIPAVLGSAVFKLPELIEEGADAANLLPFAVGFITAAVFGYLAIRMVRALMKRGSFKLFAYYCAAVGVVTVIVSLMN